MTDWQPIETAPKDGRSILLWARLRANPPESSDHFELVGYYHQASGVERWKSRETDKDLVPDCWAPIPKPPGSEAAQ
jgi:hypothetical protein